MRIAVVGAGVVGLAVTYELARRGHDVRCYEAASPMGQRSTGDTRIFRFVHATPDLVHWAQRARRGWTAWSETAGEDLVGSQRTVVSGDIDDFARAMSGAGVPHEVIDQAPTLPTTSANGPFLIDPAGGVIRAAATGRFLLEQVAGHVVHEAVTSLEVAGSRTEVRTLGGSEFYDSVVVAAGAGTPALAAQVGVHVPSTLVHHARACGRALPRDRDRVRATTSPGSSRTSSTPCTATSRPASTTASAPPAPGRSCSCGATTSSSWRRPSVRRWPPPRWTSPCPRARHRPAQGLSRTTRPVQYPTSPRVASHAGDGGSPHIRGGGSSPGSGAARGVRPR